MSISRRDMLKKSLLGIVGVPLAIKTLGINTIARAADALKDAKVSRMDYIHSVVDAADPAHKDHAKLSKNAKFKKYKTDGFLPKCDNCKQYKKPDGDWGNCAMVGARGEKNGMFVFKDGMCKVYAKK